MSRFGRRTIKKSWHVWFSVVREQKQKLFIFMDMIIWGSTQQRKLYKPITSNNSGYRYRRKTLVYNEANSLKHERAQLDCTCDQQFSVFHMSGFKINLSESKSRRQYGNPSSNPPGPYSCYRKLIQITSSLATVNDQSSFHSISGLHILTIQKVEAVQIWIGFRGYSRTSSSIIMAFTKARTPIPLTK